MHDLQYFIVVMFDGRGGFVFYCSFGNDKAWCSARLEHDKTDDRRDKSAGDNVAWLSQRTLRQGESEDAARAEWGDQIELTAAAEPAGHR